MKGAQMTPNELAETLRHLPAVAPLVGGLDDSKMQASCC